ncbi:hypothetical protein F383_11475 [Gossypium arboreum]|uniref:Uncharacterized protein n=1 Tax=Gossypium arboreum TaxID=29729 RepID=A0A0B0NFC0_GOSAR|nr:hypothetical protein F383_11475 [Gossypium arboreum]
MHQPHCESKCKNMSGTWHRHRDISVRPCLGHGIELRYEPV